MHSFTALKITLYLVFWLLMIKSTRDTKSALTRSKSSENNSKMWLSGSIRMLSDYTYHSSYLTLSSIFIITLSVFFMFWVDIEQSTSFILFLYRFSNYSPQFVSRYSLPIFIFCSFFFLLVLSFHNPVDFFFSLGSLFSNACVEGNFLECVSLCRDLSFISTYCSSYYRS